MERIEQKLLLLGYKLTAPRKAVLGALSRARAPMSARALHKKLKGADLASVYRTLNLLETADLVNVELVEKEKLYCLATAPHHHIICKKCGYMEEVECDHQFSTISNFINIRHQLTLTGLCNRCA